MLHCAENSKKRNLDTFSTNIIIIGQIVQFTSNKTNTTRTYSARNWGAYINLREAPAACLLTTAGIPAKLKSSVSSKSKFWSGNFLAFFPSKYFQSRVAWIHGEPADTEGQLCNEPKATKLGSREEWWLGSGRDREVLVKGWNTQVRQV